MIRTIGFCFSVLFAVGVAHADTRILVVGTAPDHKEGTHEYKQSGQLLAERWDREPNVSATAVIGWPVEPKLLADLDVIVFYSRPIGDMVLHPDHRNRFVQLMQQGTGLVCIHWGTGVGYSSLADRPEVRGELRALLGGWFRRPPCGIKITSAELKSVTPEHPIVADWDAYKLHDEFYLDPVLHANAQPLLQVEIDDKQHTVAWAFEREVAAEIVEGDTAKGRSVGITLGHFAEHFDDPRFLRLLTNATMWAARSDER